MSALFRRIAETERELRDRFGLKDQGQYAARLVADALGAEVLINGVNKGYDLEHAAYGRIEVRSRRYPLDGRREDRVQVPKAKAGLFDHFAHVVLNQDFTVVGAYLAPHDAIDRLASASSNRYVRFEEGKTLSGAIDITARIRAAQD